MNAGNTKGHDNIVEQSVSQGPFQSHALWLSYQEADGLEEFREHLSFHGHHSFERTLAVQEAFFHQIVE